jgi:fibronectin-binding autotransporter adhesin
MLLGLTLVIGSTALHAQTLTWDTSTTAGFQNANGTWGTDNFWTATNSGTALAGWTSGATAWFGGNSLTGTNATGVTNAASPGGNFTVTVSGTQTANTVRQIQNGAGNFTLTGGTLVLTGNGVRADRGTFTVNSVITNSAPTLQLYAAGLLILGGNNTYTATSDIRGVSGGTVRLNNAGALGTGSSVQFTIGSVLLDLNGFDVSGKTISITAGQTGFLGNASATKSVWSGNVTLNTTGILRAGGTNAEVEISGIISGSTGSLQSFDGGTLRLSGDNTYSGGTSVRDGSKLIVAHTNALGSLSATNSIQAATLDLNGFDIGNRIITLQDNASRLVNDNTNSAAAASGPVNMLTNRSNAQIGGDGNLTLSGSMATQDGTGGGFTKVGTGTLSLGGSNNYAGATTISAGTLRLNNANALGGNSVLFSGGTNDLNGFNVSGKTITVSNNQTAFLANSSGTKSTWSGDVTLTNTTAVNLRAGGTSGEVEISGVISGSSGNQVQSMDSNILRLSGANTFDGQTVARASSTLIVGNASALGSTTSGTFINTGATLDLNGFNVGNEAITLQTASSRLVNNNGSSAATVGGGVTLGATSSGTGGIGGDGNLSIAGVVSGAFGFSKIGAGTLTLSASNTYTGTTTVSSGTLMVSNASLTATIQSNSVAVAFTNTPTNGTYAVLPGPVGAASFVSNSVTGLGGKTATMTNSPNLVVLVSGGPTGSTFKGAYPSIIDPSEINPANGLSYLMNYALGGTGIGSTPALPVLTVEGNILTLTATVRNDDPSLLFYWQWTTDLAGDWNDVPFTPTGASSSAFSINVEPGQPRKFLRLKATLEP